jgi:hypothetical protein
MSRPKRLWQTLDELPGWAAPTLDWRKRLGKEFDQVGKLLRPTSELAASVDCPSPGGDGCPRRVVDHGGGRFVAVCGDSPRNCDDLTLTKPDLVIRRIDEAVLCKGIAAALSLSAPAATGTGQPGILHVGDFEPIAGKRFPVYLAIQLEQEALEPLAVRLWGVASTSFILLTPTRRAVDVGLGEKMAGWKARTAALVDLLEGNATTFAATDAARTLLAEFRTAVLPADETKAGMRFPTPAGATWGDIVLEFREDQVLSAKCKGESRRVEPVDLGMKNERNGKPTLQWTTLRAIAQSGGQLDCRDPKAYDRIKSQKYQLSKKLRAYFQIEEDPIYWNSTDSCWQARFIARPADLVGTAYNKLSASVAARQQQPNKAVPSQRRSTR